MSDFSDDGREHNGYITAFLTRVVRLPPWISFLVVLALFTLIFSIDDLTRGQLNISGFYLLPLTLATWVFGVPAGLLVGILSTAATFLADIHGRRLLTHPVFLYWDAGMHFAFFAVFSVILAELRRMYRRIAELARIDGLTGLANRRRFYELAEHELNRARRLGTPLTAAHIDIDNFKNVNDDSGHATGDKVLGCVGDALKGLRKTDVASRLGGDEFVVLMPDTGREAALLVVGKLHREMLESVRRGGWPVTFSIGVATFIMPPATVEEMVHEADAAMYSVKKSTKNDVRFAVFGLPVRGGEA